jgi:CPA2 family monovalent cation:H+ antiporter-2
MASTINIVAYSDALVLLGTAGVVVPIVRRLGISPVLGYLAAGAVLGPLGLGSLVKTVPVLSWFTITDAKSLETVAELGVVFLLFLIGLELSPQHLLSMRRLVFGFGSLQVILTSAVLGGIAALLGQDAAASIVFGLSLSLSSTAIVLEILLNEGRLSSDVGRTSFGVLLAQDLAVIPILMFISIAGEGTHGSVAVSLLRALAQAALAVAAIVVLGRVLVRPLIRIVANTHSSELFIAVVLFVILGAGVIASQASLSMALGAFVAGLLLAETEYGKAIQATVEPFKGLLLGVFFFTVGMDIDYREILRDGPVLIAGVALLIAIKAAVLTPLARISGLPWSESVETGLLLSQSGEFAFVSIGIASTLALIDRPIANLAIAITSITMALTPLLSATGRQLKTAMKRRGPIEAELTARPPQEPHAIIVGYGRVGKVVASLLKEHNVPFIASDSDADSVVRDRRDGHEVYYGNAADPEFLKVLGLAKATGVIVTIGAHEVIDDIVTHVRAVRPDVLVVARARDAEHASHLYNVGASDAVPETVEASLQLSEAALVGLGVAMGPVIASIHEKRDAIRRELQSAAQIAGREDSYIVKRKTLRSAGGRPE